MKDDLLPDQGLGAEVRDERPDMGRLVEPVVVVAESIGQVFQAHRIARQSMVFEDGQVDDFVALFGENA